MSRGVPKAGKKWKWLHNHSLLGVPKVRNGYTSVAISGAPVWGRHQKGDLTLAVSESPKWGGMAKNPHRLRAPRVGRKANELHCPYLLGPRRREEWLHNPCGLGGPKMGKNEKGLHNPCLFGVPRVGRNGYITRAISGVPKAKKISNRLHDRYLLRAAKVGRNGYITPKSQKQEELRNSYITLDPCRLRVPKVERNGDINSSSLWLTKVGKN